MRILIVDDDPSTLLTLQSFLEASGYEVRVADDGQQAFELIQQEDFRLVISDWEMPRMDGLELCRQIRKRQLASYVYFILLTGREKDADLVAGLNAGADDFLTKPFNPEELRVRLNAANRVASLEARDVLIFSLAKLAESRDSDTGDHLERMREYCLVLAEELATRAEFQNEVDADFVRTIYATSPLHDIGKVGIPDNILLKPGKLNREEYEIMKTHTLIGAETLQSAVENNPGNDFYQFARDIVLHHHERYDGKGYPHGLAGNDIPLCARILAVADVYDALTTKRVYKPAFTHEKAKSIIVGDRGTAFDPAIVDAFLAKEAKIVSIQRQLSDNRRLTNLGKDDQVDSQKSEASLV